MRKVTRASRPGVVEYTFPGRDALVTLLIEIDRKSGQAAFNNLTGLVVKRGYNVLKGRMIQRQIFFPQRKLTRLEYIFVLKISF